VTRFLLATASVHTTAAAADYLDGRLDADDEVVVLTVDEPGVPARDASDAVNVARSRLLPATVTVREREGDPAAAVRATLDETDADELLVGSRRGDPDAVPSGESAAALGSTTRALLGTVDVPVIVLPAPDL